jgi:hypothetical protein
MLETFGMQYRRLIAAFQRIFGVTIFFGTDTQRDRAADAGRLSGHGRAERQDQS